MRIFGICFLLVSTVWCCCSGHTDKPLVASGATLDTLATGFRFTEGPQADAEGNVYFTDIPNNRIHIWTLEGKLDTFRENSGGANGLAFDRRGNLIACEGRNRQLTAITPAGEVTVLADKYNEKKLNSPNDLWIHPNGGIYFSDPRYGNREGLEQDGEHVYYLSPDYTRLTRVIADMVRPNGLVGTPDGKLLYVTDQGANKTYVYQIEPDGTLSHKKMFCEEGSDGMTIDNEGNVYLTSSRDEPTFAVTIYNPSGEKIEEIVVPEKPTNVCFGGKDKRTLFITARTSVYIIQMRVKGIQ